MVFVLGECSQLHAVSLQEVIIKGEPSEMTAGVWVYLWGATGPVSGSWVQGRKVWQEESPSVGLGGCSLQGLWDCSEEQTAGLWDNRMNFLGIRRDWQVQRSSESYLVIQSYAYEQESVSRDTMGRGESCLWNCFIFYLSDVFTLNFFYTLKTGLLVFYKYL